MRSKIERASIFAVLTTLSSVALAGTPLDSGFTYQGRLLKDGQPYDGTIGDMRFQLWDAAQDGKRIGTEERLQNVTVMDGLFTVVLNSENRLGGDAFNGEARWLEISIERTTLAPRQALTVAPYALQTRGLYVAKDLNVGIGTTEPKAELDVNGTTRTRILQIVGGADVAEPFNVNPTNDTVAAMPGMVVSIDVANPGELSVSRSPYDRKVAGIISGANGVNPGLTLQQDTTLATGKQPVALTGRVYCYVDADAGGAIEPGDLLTTSATPGHAMKVSDHDRAQGAVIGKAMTPLKSGKGLVLVLVNLQ